MNPPYEMYDPDCNSNPFDVRLSLPHHTDITVEDPPYAERLYQQVNLMIFLLGDIKIGALYGDLKEWFPTVVERTNNDWPRLHRDFPDFLKDLILEECGHIQQYLDDTPGAVNFRLLWERPMQLGMRDLLAPFRRLAEHPQLGHCFCFPFLKFQPDPDPGNIQYVAHDVMQRHIDDMADETLLGLYTKRRRDNTDLAGAVRRGINAGILTNAGNGIASIAGGGGNNNRICDGGLSTCISHTGSWCNADPNGYCTVAGG